MGSGRGLERQREQVRGETAGEEGRRKEGGGEGVRKGERAGKEGRGGGGSQKCHPVTGSAQ